MTVFLSRRSRLCSRTDSIGPRCKDRYFGDDDANILCCSLSCWRVDVTRDFTRDTWHGPATQNGGWVGVGADDGPGFNGPSIHQRASVQNLDMMKKQHKKVLIARHGCPVSSIGQEMITALSWWWSGISLYLISVEERSDETNQEQGAELSLGWAGLTCGWLHNYNTQPSIIIMGLCAVCLSVLCAKYASHHWLPIPLEMIFRCLASLLIVLISVSVWLCLL